MTGPAGDRTDHRHVEDDVGGQQSQIAVSGVVIANSDRQHRTIERQRAGVVGDHQARTGVWQVFDTAHLDAEPFFIEEPQRGQNHRIVVLRVEAELVDGVVTGEALANEIGNSGDPLCQIADGGLSRGLAALLELPDDCVDFLCRAGWRLRQGRRMPTGGSGTLRGP